MTEFLKCTDIGNDSFNDGFPIESCTNSKYILWKYTLIIPIFCFVSLLLPLMAFVYMFLNRNDLYKEHMIYKIGYLLSGFKENHYYWYFCYIFLFLNHKLGSFSIT